MTSSRPYRDALAFEGAAAEVSAAPGTQFDPAIAEAFGDAYAAGEIVARAVELVGRRLILQLRQPMFRSCATITS